ncbi:MAG: hypothetical protein FJZ58_06555 [Chlamydiae bacterium]|nr:hypothetical protein [Chlamydiota bacterium]
MDSLSRVGQGRGLWDALSKLENVLSTEGSEKHIQDIFQNIKTSSLASLHETKPLESKHIENINTHLVRYDSTAGRVSKQGVNFAAQFKDILQMKVAQAIYEEKPMAAYSIVMSLGASTGREEGIDALYSFSKTTQGRTSVQQTNSAELREVIKEREIYIDHHKALISKYLDSSSPVEAFSHSEALASPLTRQICEEKIYTWVTEDPKGQEWQRQAPATGEEALRSFITKTKAEKDDLAKRSVDKQQVDSSSNNLRAGESTTSSGVKQRAQVAPVAKEGTSRTKTSTRTEENKESLKQAELLAKRQGEQAIHHVQTIQDDDKVKDNQRSVKRKSEAQEQVRSVKTRKTEL